MFQRALSGSGGGGGKKMFCDYYETVAQADNFAEIDVGFHPTKVITYALYGGGDMYSVYDESSTQYQQGKARKAQEPSTFYDYPLGGAYANIYSVVGNIVKIRTNNQYSKLYICAWE